MGAFGGSFARVNIFFIIKNDTCGCRLLCHGEDEIAWRGFKLCIFYTQCKFKLNKQRGMQIICRHKNTKVQRNTNRSFDGGNINLTKQSISVREPNVSLNKYELILNDLHLLLWINKANQSTSHL